MLLGCCYANRSAKKEVIKYLKIASGDLREGMVLRIWSVNKGWLTRICCCERSAKKEVIKYLKIASGDLKEGMVLRIWSDYGCYLDAERNIKKSTLDKSRQVAVRDQRRKEVIKYLKIASGDLREGMVLRRHQEKP
jgi:hypothetical protein